jgi:hypothetical protein
VPGAGTDPMRTRKRLGPPVPGFVGPADGLPSFAWWVFDCGRMPNGDLLDVIARAGPALRAHLLAVRLAWRDATGWPTRVRAQQQQIIAHARETFTEGGLEAVDQLLATLNLSIPGLGLGLSWLKQAAAGYAVSQEEIAALRLGSPLAVRWRRDATPRPSSSGSYSAGWRIPGCRQWWLSRIYISWGRSSTNSSASWRNETLTARSW